MEGVQSTALLRSAAPQWSLAGDAQLLDVLQSIHQNIITKCQETNTKLEQMVADLDNASISLQNVNNKFMALSNSQFIESRVYDYDEILVNQTVKPEETPSKPVDRQSELMKFSASLKVVEDMHEPVHIVGSDTDTDSEGEDGDSVVLKPKDVYAHRPLPYIIGSYAWKNKWHAGLEPDDSDTDSSISKPEREVEEYSDSEPELTENIQTDRLPAPVRTESSASSELVSDQDVSFTTKPTPSDVAAELARRLGGPVDKRADTESACAHTSTTARKVYKPQQPTTSTIFSDEPPPIDEFYQSESEYSDDNDIFAELYKNKPYANTNRDQSVSDDLFGGFDDRNNNVSDDLFGRKVEAEDTFNDTDQWNEVSNTRDKQKSYLFEDESEPELFVGKPNRQTSKKDNAPSDITTVKKPVGGISLFGSNKGAENIGAAILKRNQQKSSSSDESESNVAETPKIVTQAVVEPKKPKEKDIFDDLFAKSKKLQKDSKVQESIQKEKAVIEHKNTKEKDIFDDLFAKSEKLKKNSSDNSKEDNIHKEKKVDLFNDNLFDDIDDIFTSGVVKMPNKDDKKKQKSIFDDDDDLFADVAVTNTNTTDNIKEAKSNKELFDSDDDLFNEEVKVNKELPNATRPEINNDVSKVSKTSKVDAKTSIFDESDDELFSDNEPKNLVNNFINEDTSNSASVKENKRIIENETIVPGNTENNIEPDKAKPEIQVQPVRQTNVANNVDNESNVENVTNIYDKSNTAKVFDSPSLFYEEDDQLCEVAPKQVENIKTTKIISDHERPTERNIESENNSIKGSAVIIHDIIETYEEKLANTPENIKLLVENEFLDNDQQNVQNDIFKDSNVTTQNENVYEDPQRNVNFISEPTTADNYIEIGTNSTENDQKTNMQNDNEIPEEKDAHTNNDFNDIFGDLPPAFEKPKEPKKSKNVNALFDDDSDDEALFFKKNDAVLDEKPELSNTSEYLFGLFHDEPPAMDVDFKQKSNKTGFDISDDELFSSQPKTAQEESLSKIVTEPPPLQQPANMFDKDVNVVPTNTDFDISDDELFDSHPKRIRPTNKIINESPPPHQPKISKTSNDVLITKIANIKQKPNSIDFDDSEDELFGSQPKTTKTQSSTETINKRPPIQKSDIAKTTEQSDTFTKTVVADETRSKFTDLDLSDDELFGSKPNTTEIRSSNQNIKETLQSTDSKITKTVDNNDINKNDDKKTVGKLKPINLNINVNTLLPGASPKKVKKIDQIDGQTVSTHSNEDLNTDVTIKDEPLMVKSVSFEGDPDSKVLDNKLSKERAKIQIKRRPSTRRARRDAARKSAIDFGNDSTDNSSSFDDKTASESTDKTDYNYTEQKGQDTIMDKTVPDETIESDAIKVLNIEKNIHNDVPKDIERASKVSNIVKEHSEDNVSKSNTTIDPINDIYKQNVGKSREDRKVTSKTVYILNDEDIFSTNATESKTKLNEKSQKQILNIVDDDDLFKNAASNSNKIVEGVKTLGQVYTQKDIERDSESDDEIFKGKTNKKSEDKTMLGKAKKSLFDDLSDDDSELFNNKSKSKTLFNSDSDDDLFTGSSKRNNNRSATKQKEIKEDKSMFENRSKVTESKPSMSTQRADAVTKTTEPVFEDPLSMFGNKH